MYETYISPITHLFSSSLSETHLRIQVASHSFFCFFLVCRARIAGCATTNLLIGLGGKPGLSLFFFFLAPSRTSYVARSTTNTAREQIHPLEGLEHCRVNVMPDTTKHPVSLAATASKLETHLAVALHLIALHHKLQA